MSFWDGRRVLVTGGAGFIGSYVVEQLVEAGTSVRVADNLSHGSLANLAAVVEEVDLVSADLRNYDDCLRATQDQEIVMHLAAKVRGVGYSRTHHGDMLATNLSTQANLIQAAHAAGAGRALMVSSACVYPEDAAVPNREEEGMRGSPEPPNEGYGWAKRMAERLAEYFARETSMDVVCVRPFNAYGPRESFDEHAHVIPALIRRAVDGEDPLVVWGSGQQARSFLHARDLARAVILLTEHANTPEPVNVASEEEVTMAELVEKVVGAAGVRPRIEFDTSKPDGHPRRAADLRRLRSMIGWVPDTPLRDGIPEMVAAYETLARRAEVVSR